MIRVVVLMLSVATAGGCATLLRGSRQTLTFVTQPTGAQLEVDGKMYTTPAKISLRRKTSHDVVVEKAGYHTVRFVIQPQYDGISLVGNLILPGGSAGLVIDHADGADMNFYHLAKIHLTPATSPNPKPLVLDDFQGQLITPAQEQQAIIAERNDHSSFFRGEP